MKKSIILGHLLLAHLPTLSFSSLSILHHPRIQKEGVEAVPKGVEEGCACVQPRHHLLDEREILLAFLKHVPAVAVH